MRNSKNNLLLTYENQGYLLGDPDFVLTIGYLLWGITLLAPTCSVLVIR